MFIFRFSWFIFTGTLKVLFLITAGLFLLSGVTTFSQHIHEYPILESYVREHSSEALEHIPTAKIVGAFSEYKSYLKDYVTAHRGESIAFN